MLQSFCVFFKIICILMFIYIKNSLVFLQDIVVLHFVKMINPTQKEHIRMGYQVTPIKTECKEHLFHIVVLNQL